MAPSRNLVLIALATLSAVACSFEWGVRQDSSVDAAADAAPDSAPFKPGIDSGLIDASEQEASPSVCSGLASALVTARNDAVKCPAASVIECLTTVKDACGCDFAVRHPSSKETTDYLAARDAFIGGGCTADCSAGCKVLVPPASRGCFPADGGPTFACFQ